MSTVVGLSQQARVSVLDASVDVVLHRLDHPLVLSGGTVTDLPEITARVTIDNGTDRATGTGAANLSDAWSWPETGQTSADKQRAMISYARQVADTLPARVGPRAHPLELGLRLHDTVLADAEHPAPALARAICASAFDAALHDACGQLMNVSAFSLYDVDVEVPSADDHFPDGAVAAIRAVLGEPASRLRGWWLIAPGDDLDEVGPKVAASGMTNVKIKVSGADPEADAATVARIHGAAASWCADPVLSLDPNEGSASPGAIARFLDALGARSPNALAALSYLEQPTPRTALARDDWSAVSRRIPVLVDEALASMADLDVAARQGWSGVAVKTCKGHSFSLAAAAWAVQHGLVVSVQDLTNIGLSAIHSYLLAAHLPTINGVELNSPQYLPSANDPWLPRLSGLFRPTGGWHALDPSSVIGLGSRL